MSALPPTMPAPSAPAPAQRPRAWTSDERLAELARDGDERAFEVLVERYRSQLLAHARRVAGDRAAEDAVQHALVCAWRALRRRRDVRHVRAWLFKIVHRAALQTLRERREIPIELVDSVHPQAVSVEEEFERSMRTRAALAALAALPLREREALVGTSVEGRSANDVARDLGIADGALRQLVFRARTRARAAVGAFTPPVLVLRLRTLARGWHRRAHAVISHAAASLHPISNSVAVGSAIVIAAGAQVAGVPLIPSGDRPAQVSSGLILSPDRARSQPSAPASTAPRIYRGAARPHARRISQARTTSAAAIGRAQLPVQSATAGSIGSRAGLLRSHGDGGALAMQGGEGPTPGLLASPAAPLLAAPGTPTAGDADGVSEATAGAVAGVAGRAGEVARAAPQTVEHVVTTIVEPIASGATGAVESVSPRSH